MKTLLATAAVAAALLTAAPTMAGSVYADAMLLATIESIDVVLADDVKDGCLLNASGIKARFSAMLERSGIPVSNAGRWLIAASFIGGQTENERGRMGCVMASRYELLRPGPGNTWTRAGHDASLNIGPGLLDDRAINRAEQFADEVIAAILAARRSVGASASGQRS
jgi:hypothetical protein